MFDQLSLAANLGLFAFGSVVIWWSGTRLERITDAIADRTGMGAALAGLVLLAVATSLPEIATTTTAVLRGNVELAVHNLLGGTAFQVVVLVIADSAARRGPLTGYAPSFGLLLQAVGIVAMLGVAVCGLVLAERAQFAVPVGFGTVGLHPVMLLLPAIYLVIVRLTRRAHGLPRWEPVGVEQETSDAGETTSAGQSSMRRLTLRFACLAALVTAGGWLTASAADVMAVQSGLSSALIGATLLAAATSLPEVSTTVAASRNANEALAVSNVMGSNSFDVALLAVASILAGEEFSAGMSATFMAGLAIVLTCVYLVGLLERSRRSVGWIGLDSVIVVGVYLGAVGVLFLVS